MEKKELEKVVVSLHEQLNIHQNAISYCLTKIHKLCDEEENSAKEQEQATKENVQEKQNTIQSPEAASDSKLKIVK